MNSIAKKLAAVLLSISMTGCSFAGSRTQMITVSSDPSGAEVFFNGESVGRTPLKREVKRRDELLVEVRAEGYETGYRKGNRSLSTVGMADVIVGSMIVLPLLGLLSSAAWEHDPGVFGITLDPIPAPETAPSKAD